MYAIFECSGTQVKVTEGEEFRTLNVEQAEGDEITFDQILMIGNDKPLIGKPYVDGAKVVCEVVKKGKGDKIVICKFKKRKKYRRKTGHRDLVAFLKVKEIVAPA